MFERELGRTLSSFEYELINKWIENGVSEETIKEALKEAILNITPFLNKMQAISTRFSNIPDKYSISGLFFVNNQVQRYNFFPMIQRKVSKKLKTKDKIAEKEC